MIMMTHILIKPHPVYSLGLFNNTGGLLGNVDGKPTQSNIKLDRLLDYLWKDMQLLANQSAASKRFIKTEIALPTMKHQKTRHTLYPHGIQPVDTLPTPVCPLLPAGATVVQITE